MPPARLRWRTVTERRVKMSEQARSKKPGEKRVICHSIQAHSIQPERIPCLHDIALAGTSRRLCYCMMIALLRVTSSAVAGRVRPRAVVAAVVRRCVDTGAAAASSSTASPPAPPLSTDPRYVDSAAAPASFPLSSALVYPEAVSEREADAVVQDIQLRMKRRRYEKGHWDAVITHHKEIEMPLPSEVSIGGGGGGGTHPLSDVSVAAINRIRHQLGEKHFGPGGPGQEGRTKDRLPIQWIPCHGIDLKKEGQLTAHVDSVRYSGLIVAGLSLLSSSIMRLRPAAEYNNNTDDGTAGKQHLYGPKASEAPDDGHVDLYLPPRSLYVLSGVSRYEYTHELLPDGSAFEMLSSAGGAADTIAVPVPRDRRISVIFRDAKEGH